MKNGPLFRSSRRTKALVEQPQSAEEELRAVNTNMPTHSDVANDIDSGIVQQAPKGKNSKPGRSMFSIRDAYAIRENENKEIASAMLRSPRTNVDDHATTDDEELLVLMDGDGSQIGRPRGLTNDAPSQTNIKEARILAGNADSPIACSRQRRTRSSGSIGKSKPNLSIIDLSQYNFLEHREPETYACFRDDKTTATTSADSSRREMPPSVCRIIGCDDSERTDHHDGDTTPRRSPCIPLCGEFDRDGRNFRQLDEEIEVVATKIRLVSLPAEDARPLPPPPSPPKKYGLTSFFSGRMKKMEQARQRRRKLDQMKMEKDEKKKKGKKLGFLSSKLNKSTEEIQKQISTTKHDVLALAQEFRGRGLPYSQDEQLSSSDKASSKHLVMAKINAEEEQLFIADFDRHFEIDEPPQDPRPFGTVHDGPPSSFSSPDEETLDRRSYVRKLSTAGSKRRMLLADEQTEHHEEEQQQHDKEKVESGDQRFVADFDPNSFDSRSASFKIDEAEARDGPASEDGVAAEESTLQQQKKNLQRSPPPRAEPLPDPNAAAGLLLTKLQDQRRAAERRLEANEAARHQTISTDMDPKQIERKVRTMHELTHLQDNSKFARSVSAIAIEASILEKIIASLSQETFEDSRGTFEETLEQTDTHIKHLASLSGEPDAEETALSNNTQLSKREIGFILEDVSSGEAACNVVSAIKEELNNESKMAQPASIRKPKLTQREYQEALVEHEKQLQQDFLCAITEEDTAEEDSAIGTGASEQKRRERPASTTSPIREEESTVSGIISTSTSSTDNEDDGNEDDESSDTSEETEPSDENGTLSFDESLNSALSTCAGSAKSNGQESMSHASIHPPDAPVAPGCFWWSCWHGSSPKPIKQLEKSNPGKQTTKLTDKSEPDGLAAVAVESMRSVSTPGSYESEMNGIRHVYSAPTSQSFDEDDDLLDRIEYGLCGNRQ